jgi:hypothetical protein
MLLCRLRYSYVTKTSALKLVVRAAIAREIHATFLADALATTLACHLMSICLVHVTNGPDLVPSRCMHTRATRTSSPRRFLPPLADSQEVWPPPFAEFARDQSNRTGKVPAADVLFAVAHLTCHYTGGGRAAPRNRQ